MAKVAKKESGDGPAELPEGLSYETALAQLEQIIASLETGELALEAALACYEEGAALAAYCEQQLNEAELRVRKWQPGSEADDEPVEFDEW